MANKHRNSPMCETIINSQNGIDILQIQVIELLIINYQQTPTHVIQSFALTWNWMCRI